MIDRKDAKQLAKDVAVAVDRRRRTRKLVLFGLLIAAIVAAVLYFGFGKGWGFGKGDGKGAGSGSAITATSTADAGPARCALRVTADGISIDGTLGAQADAVTACKAAGAADVVVTGDARQGLWDDLRAALEAAGVAIHLKEPRTGSAN